MRSLFFIFLFTTYLFAFYLFSYFTTFYSPIAYLPYLYSFSLYSPSTICLLIRCPPPLSLGAPMLTFTLRASSYFPFPLPHRKMVVLTAIKQQCQTF